MKLSKRLQVLLLAGLLAILPGCFSKNGGAGLGAGADIPLGRYIEEAWELPVATDYVWPVTRMADGRILLFCSEVEGTWVKPPRGFTTTNGTDWEAYDAPWFDKLQAQEGYLNDITCGPDGTLYAIYYDEKLGYTAGYVSADGSGLVAIDGNWTAGDRSNSVVFANPVGDGEGGADVDEILSALSVGSQESADEPAGDDGVLVEDLPAGSVSASAQEDAQAGITAVTEAGPVAVLHTDDDEEEEEDYSDFFYPDSLHISSEGDLYFGFQYSGAKRFNAEGAYQRTYGESSTDMALFGNTIALVDYGFSDGAANGLSLYRLSDGGLERQLDASVLSDNKQNRMATGEDGALYLASEKGLYRLVEGGSTWEQLLDGGLSSLGIPTSPVNALIPHGDNEFLTVCGNSDGGSMTLINYKYSPDTPARPSTELTVYSLYPSETLKQAAGEFRRLNPDVMVTIQTPLQDDGAATAGDAIRALNTQLLNGDGPDILLLDGLPIQSYMEKGVLADLTGWADPLIVSDLYENIAGSLRQGDKVYAIPARFRFQSVWAGSAADMAAADSMDSVLAAAKSGRRVLYAMEAEELFAQLYPQYAPSFTKEDGSIDAQGLGRFLQMVSDLASTSDGPLEEDRPSNFVYSINNWIDNDSANSTVYLASDKIVLSNVVLSGFQSVMLPNGAVSRRNGVNLRSEDSFDSSAMPATSVDDDLIRRLVKVFPGGEGDKVFYPGTVLGVNAASRQQELCRAFLETALGRDVQYADLGDGFPVNRQAYADSLEKENGLYVIITMEDDMYVEAGWPSPGVFRAVEELIKELDTPYLADDTLTEMIESEAKSYFSGGGSAQDVAQTIADCAALYLNQ